jgi:hypothetical protein
MGFDAGDIPSAEDWALATRRAIARGRRTSNSSGTTTEVGVIRLDDVQLKADRLYAIEVCNIILASTVTTDTVAVNVRCTTDGSTPTTASTNLGFVRADADSPGTSLSLTRFYPAAADDLLSILVTVARAAGTGSVSITANGTVNPLDVVIWDLGDDPGDTGVDI